MAAAACAMYDNYKAKQAKTAAQVEDEYRAAQGDLPDVPTLASYQTNFTPSEVVEKGGTVKADVEILVVPGKEGGPILIEEQWEIYDAKGERWLGPVRKAVNASNREAGLYVGGFSLNLPKEMPQGKYEFRSQVYLNGSAVTSVTQGIQIAHHQADPARVVLAQR